MQPFKTTRRTFLAGLGISPALAPFIPVLSQEAKAAGAGPKRLVIMHTPNGLLRQELLPEGETFKRILAPCVRHQKDMTVVDGLHMNSFFTQSPSIANDHPPPLGHLLTGANTIDPKDGKAPSASSSWFASDISIDQYLAKRIAESTTLRFPSLVLGVDVGYYGWHISHSGSNKPVFPDNDATKVMQRLLDAGANGSATPDPALTRLWQNRKSVRDAVRADLQKALTIVGAEDKARVDAHLTLLGEMEKRESAQAAGSGQACKTWKAPPAVAGDAFVTSGKKQLDNIALALACDLTRVVTLQWDICASYRKFPWIGVNEAHHEMAHASPVGATYEGLTKIGAWYGEQFAGLIDRLKSIPEGGGTVFDNTLVIWCSEHSLSSGDHGRKNLPFILAGSMGGALRMGGTVRLDRAHNDLFVSLAHAMGFADVATFGKKEVCKGRIDALHA